MAKTFHTSNGYCKLTTLTVKELRGALALLPDDLPLIAEWEGTKHGIMPKNWDIEIYHAGNAEEKCAVLMIDVEFDNYGS